MATAAGNVVYSQVLKKKLADIFRVGTGGGLCFCGINMYFKNDKFYDDWVMPLFTRMEPETAYAVAQRAAKYKLVSQAKLQESKLLVSKQPVPSTTHLHTQDEDVCNPIRDNHEFRGSCEDLISRDYRPPGEEGGETDFGERLYDSDLELDVTCPNLYVEEVDVYSQELLAEDLDTLCSTRESCLDWRDDSKSFINHLSLSQTDLSACESPRSERCCMTPDSPSLSMQVNIASPLRSSKMSLATVMDGANPAYEREHVMREDDECICQVEECIITCRHDDGTRTDIVHITGAGEMECQCRSPKPSPLHTTPAAF